MDYKIPENFDERVPYVEIRIDKQTSPFDASKNSHPPNESSDFGGYFYNGTVTAISGISGATQVNYIYYVPHYGPNPEFEVQMVNFDRLSREEQEVRRK